MAYSTSWQDLKDHFKQVGKFVYTTVMEEKPGRSKGCGIVQFDCAESAVRAITELNDSMLGGRMLTVREDREDHDVKSTAEHSQHVAVIETSRKRPRHS